jgi:STE20-related kinase adapter protein alpha
MFSQFEVRSNLSKNISLAVHKPSNNYVAIKRIMADNSDEELKSILEEISLVLKLQHSSIIEIHSVYVQDMDVLIVYPFFCFGSCKEAMKNFFFTGFPEIISALIIKDVLHGLDYLHSRDIIHRFA